MKKLPESIRKKADKTAAAIIEQTAATSVQYTVMHKDKILLSGAYGVYDKRRLRALDNNTMFGVGSISKVYVTASALLLSDKGMLDIDKPYKSYVPEFEMADARYEKITTRMLMNHTSGIYGTHFKGSFLFEDPDTYVLDSLIDNLKSCTLKYEPGEYSEYCNDAFQLIEILVERLSGMKYSKFLEKNFFEPLSIKNTKAPTDSFDMTRIARAYNPMCDGAMPVESTNVIGSGGILSTTEDLCRFGRVLMGKTILSEKSAIAMRQKEYLNGFWPTDEEQDNFFAYGLGWDHVHVPPFDKFGIQAVSKGGDTMQFHGILLCIPEHDLSAAALSSGGASFLNLSLATMLLLETLKKNGIIDKIPKPKIFKEPEKSEMPDNLLKYAGLYGTNGEFARIEFCDGEFELPDIMSFVPPQKYIYAGDGKFTSADGKTSVHFQERNDLTFLQADIALEFPDIGITQIKTFAYQKLEPNAVDGDAARLLWAKRKGKKYFVADEKFSSMSYALDSPISVVEMTVEDGYAHGGCRIIDENSAKNVLYFRDVVDLQFREENGAEYLSARGSVYICEDSVEEISPAVSSVTIGNNGYAKYYKVGESAAGRTLTVRLPDTAAFAFYDEKYVCKSLSTITGKNTTELVKGGLLAFVANSGDTFELTFTEDEKEKV